VSLLRYEFLPQAESELAEAVSWYDAAEPGFGTEFVIELQQAIDLLLNIPSRGRSPGSLRKSPIASGSFTAFLIE
jgi:plasmid stabilization system protein ParE